MAICKKCGKPLILRNGKCIYCGAEKGTMPLQHGSTNVTIQQIRPQESINSMGVPILTFNINGVSFNMVKVEGGSFYEGIILDKDYSGCVFDEYGANIYGYHVDNKTIGALTIENLQKCTGGRKNWKELLHKNSVETFYIGECTVTQALWKAVMFDNGNFGRNYDINIITDFIRYGSPLKGDDLPLHGFINEKEVFNLFISRLNALTGWEFTIPTKNQWTYAARGGKLSRGYKYAGSNNIDDVAWYWDNSWRSIRNMNDIHPVKLKLPNELGLYDMSGNVSELFSSCVQWEYSFIGGGFRSVEYVCRVDIDYCERNIPSIRLVLNSHV